MSIAIVYDSVFGNTGTVARAISSALEESDEVSVLTVQEASSLDMSKISLLVVGSPTRGFRPTPSISEFVEGLPKVTAAKSAAVFDTRLDLETISPPALRWVVDAGGYAGDRLATMLARHGFKIRGDTGGFLVSGTEGPLKPGELDRARAWAKALAQKAAY